jgi:hypothetical protein
MKKYIFLPIILLITLFITLLNCVSTEKEAPFAFSVQFMPAEPENAKPTKEPDAKATKKPRVTPTPKPDIIIKAKVVQLSQKTKLLLNKGLNEKGLKKGLTGIIYNDASMKVEAGKAKLDDVRQTFSYATVIEDNMKIDVKNAIVVFRIKQK